MKSAIGLLGIVFLAGCGVIPGEYRGTYLDPESGDSLTLKARKGVYTEAGGRKIKVKAKGLSFKNLKKGQSGAYVADESKESRFMDVFWISPDPASRRERSGLLWYTADILYTQFDRDLKEKAQRMEFFRCERGRVMLDLPTSRWQVGCPANPRRFSMVRED